MAVEQRSPVDVDELPFVDMASAAYRADPFAVLRSLRSWSFVRSARGVEVLSYPTVRRLQADQRFETLDILEHPAGRGGPLTREFMTDGRLVNMTRERHDRIRRVMMKGFAPSRIAALRTTMREIAERLLGQCAGQPVWDFVDHFSHRYSIEVLTRLIGVSPEAIPVFERATLDMRLVNRHPVEPALPVIEAAMGVLRDYCARMIEAKRAGADADDFVSTLIAVQRDSDRLTESELLWNVANLLFAGHDTTRYQLASVVRALLENGQWRRVAADPSAVPGAVSEGMRFFPVGLATSRVTVADDVVVDGLRLPRGTHLYFNMLAAGRDPQVFDDPDRFDIDRPNDNPVFFGNGLHRCLGDRLARSEMEVAIEVLSTRYPRLHLAGGTRIADADEPLWGPDWLPVAAD